MSPVLGLLQGAFEFTLATGYGPLLISVCARTGAIALNNYRRMKATLYCITIAL